MFYVFVSKILFHLNIVYVILLYMFTCITGPHREAALLIVLSRVNITQ